MLVINSNLSFNVGPATTSDQVSCGSAQLRLEFLQEWESTVPAGSLFQCWTIHPGGNTFLCYSLPGRWQHGLMLELNQRFKDERPGVLLLSRDTDFPYFNIMLLIHNHLQLENLKSYLKKKNLSLDYGNTSWNWFVMIEILISLKLT